MRLGGVELPHDRGLLGHSDADVLLHAICDALLGAVALGDIGERFPDTDPVNRGRNSADMLDDVRDAVAAAGWQIGNLDCIVFAEEPKLGPHKRAIQDRLAAILQVDPDRIGVKAKSGEKSGPVGRQETIAAQCVVLLESF